LNYMPVQRWKPAERRANAELAPAIRELLCPLVEICPPGFPMDKRFTAKTTGLLTMIARDTDLLMAADAARLDPQDIDLVIDLEILPRNDQPIRFAERNLPMIDRWRSLTVLAGTFPKDLTRFKPVGRHDLPYEEWHYFNEHVLQNSDLAEYASFGDFTIQHPVYTEPPKPCHPSASIRYALHDSCIIMKGESLTKRMVLEPSSGRRKQKS